MSARDKDLLEDLPGGHGFVAELLGAHRQAVTRGVGADADYFTADRLRHLHAALHARDPSRARTFARKCQDLYEVDLPTPATVALESDDPEHTEFRQLWVIGAEPLEHRNAAYRRTMREMHYSNPDRTIAYFMPPGDLAHDFVSIVSGMHAPLPDTRRASVYVVGMSAAELIPQLVIFEPGDSASMRALVHGQPREIEAPHHQSQLVEVPLEHVVRVVRIFKLKKEMIGEIALNHRLKKKSHLLGS